MGSQETYSASDVGELSRRLLGAGRISSEPVTVMAELYFQPDRGKLVKAFLLGEDGNLYLHGAWKQHVKPFSKKALSRYDVDKELVDFVLDHSTIEWNEGLGMDNKRKTRVEKADGYHRFPLKEQVE